MINYMTAWKLTRNLQLTKNKVHSRIFKEMSRHNPKHDLTKFEFKLCVMEQALIT